MRSLCGGDCAGKFPIFKWSFRYDQEKSKKDSELLRVLNLAGLWKSFLQIFNIEKFTTSKGIFFSINWRNKVIFPGTAWFLFFSFAISLFSVPVSGGKKFPKKEEIQKVLEETFSKSGIGGLAFSLVEGNSPPETICLGNYRFNSSEKFSISSPVSSKSFERIFLNISIINLFSKNKLSLDTPIRKILTDLQFQNKDFDFTVRDFLESRTSLNFQSDIQFSNTISQKSEYSRSLNKILSDTFKDDEYETSGLEDKILKNIISKVSQMSVNSYLKKEIFLPLKMNTVKSRSNLKNKELFSYGYFFSLPKENKNHLSQNDLYMTILDISMLHSYFFHSDLSIYNKENINLFFSPILKKNQLEKNISLGFEEFNVNHSKIYSYHSGTADTSVSILIVPELKLSLFFLTNKDRQPALQNLSMGVLKFLIFQKMEYIPESPTTYNLTLVGSFLIFVSLIFLINFSVVLSNSKGFTQKTLSKTNLSMKFLGSLITFLLLIYVRFLILPNSEVLVSTEFISPENHFSPLRLEINYGFLSLIMVSFLYLSYFGLLIMKTREEESARA